MTRQEFAKSLRKAIQFLVEIDVVFDPHLWSSLVPSTDFRQVAMSRSSPYEEVFLTGLRNRDYNVLLTDFSFVQFYCEGEDSDVALRFAYYPNPYEIPTYEEFERDYGQWSVEGFEMYLQLASDNPVLHRVPCIRYDMSKRDYRHLRHPASHLHLGLHEDNRWPLSKLLSPEAFSYLIAKLFYSDKWHAADDIDDAKVGLIGLEGRMAKIRADCEQLPRKLFSRHEKKHFHFS